MSNNSNVFKSRRRSEDENAVRLLNFAGVKQPTSSLCHWGCSFQRLTKTDVTFGCGAVFRQLFKAAPLSVRVPLSPPDRRAYQG
jgi:hypothetical protein